MDENIFDISGICVALYDYFKEHLCVRAADGQDRYRVQKICGAHRQYGRNCDGGR